MQFAQPSILTQVLQLLQYAIGLIFPIVLLVLLYLAWRDFRRLVDFRTSQPHISDEEIKEFIE